MSVRHSLLVLLDAGPMHGYGIAEHIQQISEEILQVEEKADRASRDKVRSLKKEVPEGSEEWDILQKRYYAEELKRFGIDPSK